MSGLRTIGLAIGIVFTCGTVRAGDGPMLPTQVEKVLWWLPEDTQTVLVDRVPFEVPEDNRNLAQDVDGTKSLIEALRLEMLPNRQGLEKNAVLLAVEGSRRFRSPQGLGLMPYEGAWILLFRDDVGKAMDAIVEKATLMDRIAGRRVVVIQRMQEGDLWKYYIVQPKPDVLICATNRQYLKELLGRIDVKPKTRALPDNLPEWKHLDPTAPIWAIRHYDPNDAREDPTSPLAGRAPANNPDAKAIGLVVTVGEEAAHITYLSLNPDIDKLVLKSWSYPTENVQAEIKRRGQGFVEASVPLGKGPGTRGMFMFLFLAAIGHGIYL